MYEQGVRVMVFNATFNNISVISWRMYEQDSGESDLSICFIYTPVLPLNYIMCPVITHFNKIIKEMS